MRINTKKIGKLILAGVLVTLGCFARASVQDATLLIDHALNSPTLTVRYSGAHVALVELRLNGTSYGTRNMDVAQSKGETDFTLDTGALNDGDNSVEIRLYDKGGKLLAAETRTVTADEGHKSPIYLESPRIGSTVQGPVEINVGFGRNLHNTYVSFFVDNQFKAMTNTPPYSYVWDTSHDANGWHEIEAWAVDDSSITYKTRKVKVYVNNPGGNTAREFLTPDTAPITIPTAAKVALNPIAAATTVPVSDVPSGTHTAQLNWTAAASPHISNLRPQISAHVVNPLNMVPIFNQLVGVVGSFAGVKPQPWAKAVATGPQLLLPTGKRVAVPIMPTKAVLTGPISSVPRKVHTIKPIAAAKSIEALPAIEDSVVDVPRMPEAAKVAKTAAVKVETPKVAPIRTSTPAEEAPIMIAISKEPKITATPMKLSTPSVPVHNAAKSAAKAAKLVTSVSKAAVASTPKSAKIAIPKVDTMAIVDMPSVEPQATESPKLPAKAVSTAMHVKAPTHAKLPKSETSVVSHAIASASKAAYIPVGHGTKIPHVGTYSIVMNARKVNFGAAKPRVENQVPLTPFRYLFEDDGGKVNWEHKTKTVHAEKPTKEIYIKIGDKLAKVNNLPIEMDLTPFIDHGRTIVPLSFIKDALDVEIDYDPITGHVLITSMKKKK